MDNKETYLLVMKSVFSTKFKIHKKYDLKGSTVDRQASSKEKVWVPAVVVDKHKNPQISRFIENKSHFQSQPLVHALSDQLHPQF